MKSCRYIAAATAVGSGRTADPTWAADACQTDKATRRVASRMTHRPRPVEVRRSARRPRRPSVARSRLTAGAPGRDAEDATRRVVPLGPLVVAASGAIRLNDAAGGWAKRATRLGLCHGALHHCSRTRMR